MPTIARLSDRSVNLLVDSFIGTTNELLPEWEQTLGLPDPCLGITPSISERRNEAVARFIGLGGQSIPFFISYAANLGFTITITEFAPFRTDFSGADTALADEGAAYLWLITSPDDGSWLFKTDIDTTDEALGGFGNTVLECELTRLQPAHTTLYFAVA